MPSDGESIRVRIGPAAEQDWIVDNLSKCGDYRDRFGVLHRGCGEPVFWCITLNDNKAPVNTVPDDEGLYTSHMATCQARLMEKRQKELDV
jgi:hypothetical protein